MNYLASSIVAGVSATIVATGVGFLLGVVIRVARIIGGV